MIDEFTKRFIEEATDNINELENALLELDKSPGDNQIIERIFRSLHSLKGGGAMFGFETVSNITHELENIYDNIRGGKQKISDPITSLTLEIVDHLRNLLVDPTLKDENIRQMQAYFEHKITELNTSSDAEQKESPSEKTSDENKKAKKSYYILFQPSKQILKDGTNPLYLIDELHDLGEAQVVMHSNKLPGIAEYDYNLCYIYWEIYLVTEHQEQQIKDVFLFVEDSSVIDIQMLSYDSILTEPELAERIGQLINTNSKITLNEIKGLINQKRADINKKTAIINKREQKITSIRVSSEKLDSLMNLVSELVTTQARLSLFAEKDSEGELTSIAENVQKLTRQLRDIAFSIVLIPIDTIVMRFQRLVRDLSKNLNKKVDFVAKGTDTELDKTLIESLVDPIMHIIRNSIDHGVETIDERRRLGKNETGTIKLNAYYSGVNVHIDVSDDGKGINKDKVLQQAISKGIVAENANLSDEEIYNLIFLPGFSTADTVTDVSGRGVGMDVVKKKVNEIRGEVSVSSAEGVGTVISIVIPITLSIIDGLLVVINKHHFILPMVVVDKIYSIKHSDLQQSFNDILVLDGEQIPYIHIKSKFELDGEQVESEEVVTATYNGKKIGLVIDSVVGEYQAVLKPLGNQFRKQDYITGASILGDGRIALVLDTNKMIKQVHEQKTIPVAQI